MTKCQVCDARTDAALCRACTDDLEQAIAELPALVHELDVTAAGQARVGNLPPKTTLTVEQQTADVEQTAVPAYLRSKHGRITLPSTRLPYSPDAARLVVEVRIAVAAWVDWAGAATYPTISGQCVALLATVDDIRRRTDAGDGRRRLLKLVDTIRAAVDRRDPDTFVGRCDVIAGRTKLAGTVGPLCWAFTCEHDSCAAIRAIPDTLWLEATECGADLYAVTGETTVACPRCGTVHQVAARKRHLRDQLPDEWARPKVIVDALTTLEQPVNFSTLTTWIDRDRRDHERYPLGDVRRPARPLVLQVGVDDEGKPLYRVGDVQARIAWSRDQRSETMTA